MKVLTGQWQRRGIGLPQIFDGIVLVSDGNGRSRIGQAECRARTVLKLDFEVGPGLVNRFYFAPGGIVAGPAVLIFMFDWSSNRTKTLPGSVVTALIVRPAITFVSLWFLCIILSACSTCRGISAGHRIQLRHELALLGFSVKA